MASALPPFSTDDLDLSDLHELREAIKRRRGPRRLYIAGDGKQSGGCCFVDTSRS